MTGTGFIGVVHVEALRRLGIEVNGIVGSTPERAAEKARAENLPDPYPSFEAMLADDRVDGVHLATPNHLHDEQVRAVLAAGKHVVCEKPLAMTGAQTRELRDLAIASGLVHAVNFNQRFYPNNLHARAIVRAGDLGTVRLITGGFLQDWLLYDNEDGARGVVALSQVSAGRKTHLNWEIDGWKASAAWRAERPEELWIGRRDAPSELRLRDPGLLAPRAAVHTSKPAGHAEGYGRRSASPTAPSTARSRRAGRRTRPTPRPSPTGTSRRSSPTRSPVRTRRASG